MSSEPDQPEPDQPAPDQTAPTANERAERRRRLAEVFGDVLPEETRDDTADPQARDDDGAEDWLRRQVPPHHGQ